MTINELLEGFIGDLVDGTYSHGSDERMYANEWFDRCGFAYEADNSFLSYLLEHSAEAILDNLSSLEYYDADKSQYEDDLSDEEYPWADMVLTSSENPEGVSLYATKEDWLKDCNEKIQVIEEDIEVIVEDVKERFQDYKQANKHHGTFEDEMEEVKSWYESYKSALETPSYEKKISQIIEDPEKMNTFHINNIEIKY